MGAKYTYDAFPTYFEAQIFKDGVYFDEYGSDEEAEVANWAENRIEELNGE